MADWFIEHCDDPEFQRDFHNFVKESKAKKRNINRRDSLKPKLKSFTKKELIEWVLNTNVTTIEAKKLANLSKEKYNCNLTEKQRIFLITNSLVNICGGYY